ncbi:MAG: hypothetical protein QHH09_02605 [Microgenomates group bacterium]|nr:hypothetical protein [Microgenomates group bacterium]
MSANEKYRIIFDDQTFTFNYEDEVIYRLSHELSHKLLYWIIEKQINNNPII